MICFFFFLSFFKSRRICLLYINTEYPCYLLNRDEASCLYVLFSIRKRVSIILPIMCIVKSSSVLFYLVKIYVILFATDSVLVYLALYPIICNGHVFTCYV